MLLYFWAPKGCFNWYTHTNTDTFNPSIRHKFNKNAYSEHIRSRNMHCLEICYELMSVSVSLYGAEFNLWRSFVAIEILLLMVSMCWCGCRCSSSHQVCTLHSHLQLLVVMFFIELQCILRWISKCLALRPSCTYAFDLWTLAIVFFVCNH